VSLSGVRNAPLADINSESVVVLGYPNSESPQQDSADEREHGTHHQNIEPQGKVHVTLLRFE
jgi:hypothetical protein